MSSLSQPQGFLRPRSNAKGEDSNSGTANTRAVARVSKLLIHPIKSCRGISVPISKYSQDGLQHDRTWAILDARKGSILTARNLHKMVLITPVIMADTSHQYGGELVVTFPAESGCESFSVALEPTSDLLSSWNVIHNAKLFTMSLNCYVCQSLGDDTEAPSRELSRYLGCEAHLVYKGPIPRICEPTSTFPDLCTTTIFQDGYPLLVVSEESLMEVQIQVRDHAESGAIYGVEDEWKSRSLMIERFRPNIVVRGVNVPFAEDSWSEVVFSERKEFGAEGTAVSAVKLVSKCTRCLLPNVDPTNGLQDKAIPFKVLMKFRRGADPSNPSKACFGCNGAPEGRGIVQVGDYVYVRALALV